jgi:hypothetical protein
MLSVLARDYYGNHKPEALVRCFDVFILLNLGAIRSCTVPPPSSLLQGDIKFVSETVFDKYFDTVHHVLNENIRISCYRPTAVQKLEHYYFMFCSLSQEDAYMQQYILRPYMSKTLYRKYRAKVCSTLLEYFGELTVALSIAIRECFKKYDPANFDAAALRMPFAVYTEVPSELETAFPDLDLSNVSNSANNNANSFIRRNLQTSLTSL